MTNTSPLSEQYPEPPDELRLQRIGARLLIMEMLSTMRDDWNGYGLRLWAQNKLEELDG